MNMTEGADYFLPFSRQRIYSSMMPFSTTHTLINRGSVHSTLLSKPTYRVIADNSIFVAHNCVKLDFDYTEVIWPHFGELLV